MKYYTSKGFVEKKDETLNDKTKKQAAAITFLSLALALALVIGAWLYTDYVYCEEDNDGEATKTEAVSEDNGSGGDAAPAEEAVKDSGNVEAVPVQQAEPQREEVQRVEAAPVDQDANQGTPQLRGPAPATKNVESSIKYVQPNMHMYTSWSDGDQNSYASLDRSGVDGTIPLDRAFLVANAWVPQWGHDMNPNDPLEALEFTGEIIDQFGHSFFEGDQLTTAQVIEWLAEDGVTSTWATYNLYAQYVRAVAPAVAWVFGDDYIDEGSFELEFNGTWNYKNWVYDNITVGSVTFPTPDEVDGYTFLYWEDENGNQYAAGSTLNLKANNFDEDGELYFTAVWMDEDGNIITGDEDIDDEDEDIDEDTEDGDEDIDDEDAEFETVYTETIKASTDKEEATTEAVESDSPATGDGYPLLGWAIIFVLALAGILGGVLRKKN